MSEIVSFTNRNVLLENEINEHVAKINTAQPLQLPGLTAPLVASFVKKIEGNYDTSRAKTDTDHAINLLYIAYNTTPQEHGEIRVKISGIMSRLIEAQQDSERRIKDSIRVANAIGKKLQTMLPDWLDIKISGDAAEIRQFVMDDLLGMAKDITSAATTVRDSLSTIVVKYDQILKEIGEVTASSEIALSKTIEANKKIKDEITQASARREELDSLVSALQKQIAQFEKMAADFGGQAKSAEQKSFWASLVKTASQVVSAVVPIAAMAATGGASSALGAVSIGTQNLLGNSNVDPNKVVEKSHLEAQRAAQSKIVDDRKQRVGELEAQQATAKSGMAKQELDKSLEQAKTQFRDEQAKLSGFEEQLGALLRQLETAASDASEAQKKQALSLRQLERQMLDNVVNYENVKRAQAAELAKITVLLDGKRGEEQTIELAVRSLNVSVAALKRSKEIVEEIAFFFKSFTDFMQRIVDEAKLRTDDYEKAGNSAVLRTNRLKAIVTSTDEFFITQAAEWLAVGIVSERFAQVFNEGWSKLNKLSGKYITGSELEAYLVQASQQLKSIIEAREAASNQRIASLKSYRSELEATA